MPEIVNGITVPSDGDPVALPANLRTFAEGVGTAAADAGAAAAVGYASSLDDTKMRTVLDDEDGEFRSGLTAQFALPLTPEAFGAKGDGATDDAAALQAALDAAASTGRILAFGHSKTYAIGTRLNLSGTKPTFIFGNDATIQATAAMTAVLDKSAGPGQLTGIAVLSLNLDGNMLAERCIAIERAHRPYLDGGIWKNATNTVLALGEGGGQVYEAEIRRQRIIGIDENRPGATPAAMPAYGLTLGAAVTDNLLDHIEFKNCDVFVRDSGNCNLFQGVHGFPYPFALTEGGTPDYAGAAGFELAGFGARMVACYPDTQKVGVKVSGEGNMISSCEFMWLSQWKPTAPVLGVDVLASATNTIIVGNHFSIRPSATYTGVAAVRTNAGSFNTLVGSNMISGAFAAPVVLGSTGDTDTVLGNVWSGGAVPDVRPTTSRFRRLNLSHAAGQMRDLRFQTATVDRWAVRARATAEGGSNAGSDFEIRRYTDAGAEIDAPIQIARQSGVVSINRGRQDAYVSQSDVSGAVTLDAQAGTHFVLFLTGNVTSTTLSNGANGMVVTLTYAQDATGGRTYAWPTNCRFAGGVHPQDTTPNTRTTVTLLFSGGQWRETARVLAVQS